MIGAWKCVIVAMGTAQVRYNDMCASVCVCVCAGVCVLLQLIICFSSC